LISADHNNIYVYRLKKEYTKWQLKKLIKFRRTTSK